MTEPPLELVKAIWLWRLQRTKVAIAARQRDRYSKPHRRAWWASPQITADVSDEHGIRDGKTD